ASARKLRSRSCAASSRRAGRDPGCVSRPARAPLRRCARRALRIRCAAEGTPALRRCSARRRQSGFSCSCCGACRQRERKARAASCDAFHPHPAAEMLDDLAADMQPEAAAVRLVGKRVADLMEFAEYSLVLLRADPAAVVAHIDAKAACPLSQRNLDAAIRAVAELDGV